MMRTAILTTEGFQIKEAAMPQCKANELLVKTIVNGVCAGDVFTYGEIRNSGKSEQLYYGHEGTGEVVAAGELVKDFKAGDIVTVLGGKYGEYFTVNADRAVKVPEGLEPEWALGEPLACCVHAFNRFGIRAGDKVAMVGTGFMGLICLQLARLSGASQIVAFDMLDWKLDLAARLGADEAHVPTPALIEELDEQFDVVIEVTGAPGGLDMATKLVKQHGRIVIIGYHQTNNGMREINMQQWNYKAIDIINGHVRRGDEKKEAMDAAVQLVQSGRIEIESLVSYYSLNDIEQAFVDLKNQKPGLVKAAIRF